MQFDVTFQDWQAGFDHNLKSWAFFMIAKVRRGSPEQLQRVALMANVWYRGRYVSTSDLVQAANDAPIWNGQVEACFELGCAQHIHEMCITLSQPDAEILLHASGFAGVTLEELQMAADAALREARLELYGEEY